MHEIQRSPYASPSRSPWRSSKCPRNTMMRLARRSIWTRAKPCVGLERPHFCTRFRGQSDAWVAPAHIEISSDVLPVCVAGFKRRQVKEERKSGEEGKNNSVHFQNWHFFTRRSAHGIHSEAFSNHHLCESYRAKKGKSGRSDRTLWRSIRPKVLSGSLPPQARSGPRTISFFGTIHLIDFRNVVLDR